jgi:hypothetical protein
MLVRRCAWHRRYHGYPALYGIGSWRGWKLQFTDGACARCARRVRREFNIAPPLWTTRAERRASAAPLLVPPLAVGLVALGALLLVARPLDHTQGDAPSALAADPPPSADGPLEASPVTRPRPLLRMLSPRSAFLVSARTSRPVAERGPTHDCLTAPESRPSGPSFGYAGLRQRLSSLQAP